MYSRLSESTRCYRFDGFEVDPQTGELWHRQERVPIQELPFQLLAALLERPGDLVTRDQLRERLWPPEVHLDFDISLATAVKKLRQALGDTAREPRYLETLPGRGYRFLGEVQLIESIRLPCLSGSSKDNPEAIGQKIKEFSHGESPRPRPVLANRKAVMVLGTLLGLALLLTMGLMRSERSLLRKRASSPAVPSVLALPTRVLGEAGAGYLAEAIPDTLTTLLAGVKGLETKYPPSLAEFERVEGDAYKAAEAYAVDHLILSTVTVQGDRLLLNLQLVEPIARSVRWSGQFAGTLGGYTNLVRQAAGAIVQILRPSASDPPALGEPVLGSDADLALQKGLALKREWLATRGPAMYREALAAFQEAGRLAPESPLPLVERASLQRAGFNLTRDEATLGQAETALARALELDPRSGPAWCVAADIELSRSVGHPERIMNAVFKALTYAPDDPRSLNLLAAVAPTYSIQAAVGLHAVESRPLTRSGYWNAGLGLTGAGRASEALPIIERSLRIWPEWDFGKRMRLETLFRLGNWEAAPVLAPARPEPLDEVLLLIMRGELSEARQKAAATAAGWRKDSTPRVGMDWANLASGWSPVLARLDLKEDAFWLLERVVQANMGPPLDQLLLAPELNPLRGHPRFAALTKAARAMAMPFLAQAMAIEGRKELPSYLKAPVTELRTLLSPLPER